MKLYDQIMPAEYARNHLPRIAERMESGKRHQGESGRIDFEGYL